MLKKPLETSRHSTSKKKSHPTEGGRKETFKMIQAKFFPVFCVKVLQAAALAALVVCAAPVYAVAVTVAAVRGVCSGFRSGLVTA